MLILGIILSLAGIGFFCWLLFTLAVYALPFFAGLTAALAAYHNGAGVIGAIIVAVLAGGATLAIGQIVFGSAHSPMLRAGVGLFFVVRAAIAGYHATLGLAHVGIPSEAWRQAFAIVGGVLVAGAAWTRLTLYAPTGTGGRGVASGLDGRPLRVATKDG